MKSALLLILTIMNTALYAQEKLPCENWEPGCTEKHYKHFQVMKAAAEKLHTSNPELFKELGKEVETHYFGAWIVRFEEGMIVHLSQRVPFTKTALESHESSTFILDNYDDIGSDVREVLPRKEWFYHWRPPVTGIYDADLLRSILRSYPQTDRIVRRSPHLKALEEDEVIKMFRPHTESSNENISGAPAVLYAIYRLDRYIGKPVEQQSTRMLLMSIYEKGYVLFGLPSIARTETQTPSADPNDVNIVMILTTEREPTGSTDTDKYAGGKRFRAGSWKPSTLGLGDEEQSTRPARGLFPK